MNRFAVLPAQELVTPEGGAVVAYPRRAKHATSETAKVKIGDEIVNVSPALRACLLPAGFPIVVDIVAGEINEPILLYLVDTCLRDLAGWRRHRGTASALANDLKGWFEYLYAHRILWDRVSTEDVNEYKNVFLSMISEKTKELYSPNTIRRRLSSILSFYAWAARKGLINAGQVDAGKTRRPKLSIDDDPRPELSRHRRTDGASDLLPKGYDPEIRPFLAHDAQRVLRELGPLPSERLAGGRSASHRLAAELALHTGPRIAEVEALTIWQILNLRDSKDDPYGYQPLRLTETKGLEPRTILVPNWLVSELHQYIAGEREECIGIATTKYGKIPPVSLIVHGAQAGKFVGSKIRTGAISRNFRQAVLLAGLVERRLKFSPETGESFVGPPEALRTFHDLRHTFAVWLYEAERLQGNAEPWKTVQKRLGHKSLSTTMNIYLKVVDVFEREVGDTLTRAIGEIARARSQ